MIPEFDELVEKIRGKRKELGWSQKKLANRSGVSQSLVAKLEQKMNVPNYESVRKIYRTLERELSSKGETAADLANPEVASVRPGDTRSEAAEIMKENDFSQLPVMDGERPVGVVLSRDIGLVEDDTTIEKVMKPPVATVPPETSREAVAEILNTNPAVLVKDSDAILGIITSADLL